MVLDIYKVLDEAEIRGMKFGLHRMEKALALLGHPERRLKVIHVAGTNGKGSTCSYMQSILTAGNYKVGMFTSPHLDDYCDYFMIGRSPIQRQKLKSYGEEFLRLLDLDQWDEEITKFELLTALAYFVFAKEEVDFSIIEVGLGGLWDATNVIEKPLMTVITSIDIDHSGILGNTLEEIATQKAGILKFNIPVVVTPQRSEICDTIEEIAGKKDVRVYLAKDRVKVEETRLKSSSLKIQYKGQWSESISNPLPGQHQNLNLNTALEVLELMNNKGEIDLSLRVIKEGIEKNKWQRRLEFISEQPPVLIDGAHNVQAIEALVRHISQFYKRDDVVVLFGVFRDKDYVQMYENLMEMSSHIIVTEISSHPRSLSVVEAQQKLSKVGQGDQLIFIEDEENALRKAKSLVNNDKILVIAGSFYLLRDN